MVFIVLLKKLAFRFGSCLLPVIMIMGTVVHVNAEEVADVEPELVFTGLTGNLPISDAPFYDNGFALSIPPGVRGQPFDLVVSVPSIPTAVIYFTIDGSDPTPGEDRLVTRGERIIQLSGRLPEDGIIGVHNRSGHWRESILTYHSEQWSETLPATDASILQGTAFRFRGFVNYEPVTEIITATYIIAQNPGVRFADRPIIAVTAPYNDFLYIYRHADRNDFTTRRKIFNYEYFELGETGYSRKFSLPGSSLGEWGNRGYAQRALDVHLTGGVITHPVFPGLYELYKFRLWNSGRGFHWDFMRDPFAQAASVGLNVPITDNNVAIKFINGEFWGFTTIREQTNSTQFVSTRTGIYIDNIAITDRNRDSELYEELAEFIRSHDMSTDYARERLFAEFFCQYNFMDYLIANTFFNDADWPHNNVRFFRAITPEPDSQNPYNDGRWRFILHDMDQAPNPGAPQHAESMFSHLSVFNNQVFVEQFTERANYILENHYSQEQLLALHDKFTMIYMPLLPEMYNRFAIGGSADSAIGNFYRNWLQLRQFLINREYHYRNLLDELSELVNQE